METVCHNGHNRKDMSSTGKAVDAALNGDDEHAGKRSGHAVMLFRNENIHRQCHETESDNDAGSDNEELRYHGRSDDMSSGV